MYKLYSMQRSGNSYKVRLALALLNLPYEAVEVDILRGESRTPDFLAKNPSGQVPLLEVGDDRYLAESNAILWYVAVGTLALVAARKVSATLPPPGIVKLDHAGEVAPTTGFVVLGRVAPPASTTDEVLA